MIEEIKIYFFLINFICAPFVIYKGYLDGKKLYTEDGRDVQSDIINIPPNGLENYTIFINICFYGLILYCTSFLLTMSIYFVKYFISIFL